MSTQDDLLEKIELRRARFGCVFFYFFLLAVIFLMLLFLIVGLPPYHVANIWPFVAINNSIYIHWAWIGIIGIAVAVLVIPVPIIIFTVISRMLGKS